jgi:hypothetical protein
MVPFWWTSLGGGHSPDAPSERPAPSPSGCGPIPGLRCVYGIAPRRRRRRHALGRPWPARWPTGSIGCRTSRTCRPTRAGRTPPSWRSSIPHPPVRPHRCTIRPARRQPLSPPLCRSPRQRRTRRWADSHPVWKPYQQGWTLDAIAPQVGLSRRTVQRSLQSPTLPERHPRQGRDRSRLDPDNATLRAGWHSGCRHGWHLFRPIRRQGFQGQYGIGALSVRRLRQAPGLTPRHRRRAQPRPPVTEAPRRLLTPRRATGLVLCPRGQRR